MSTARSRAEITINANDRASRQLNTVNRSLTQMAESATRVGRSMMIAGGAIMGSLALLGRQTLKTTDELWKLREQTDLTAKEIQTLGYAFEQEGARMQDIERMFPALAQRMVQAGRGTETYTRLFEHLGVQFEDTDGKMRRSIDVFMDIADAIHNATDETETLGIVTELFGGRVARNLIPLLRQGAGAVRGLMKEKESLGYLTDDEITNTKKVSDQLAKTRTAYAFMATTIGMELIPYIEKATGFMLEHVRTLREWVDRTKSGAIAGALLSGVVLSLGGAFLFTAGKAVLFARNITSVYLPAIGSATTATVKLAASGLAVWGAWEGGIRIGSRLGKVIVRIGLAAASTAEILDRTLFRGRFKENIEGNRRELQGLMSDFDKSHEKISLISKLEDQIASMNDTINQGVNISEEGTAGYRGIAEAMLDAEKASRGLTREMIGIDRMVPALMTLGHGVRGMGVMAPSPGKDSPEIVQLIVQVGSVRDITPELIEAQIART